MDEIMGIIKFILFDVQYFIMESFPVKRSGDNELNIILMYNEHLGTVFSGV